MSTMVSERMVAKMSNFIPKRYKKEQTTIRIDIEKMKRLDALAASYNMSRNEFINQCIDYALEQMDSSESSELPPNFMA